MRRRRAAKSLPSDSSDDDTPLSKVKKSPPKKAKPASDESSSESDIENYLQPVDKLDLDSPFFTVQKDNPSFEKLENEILDGVETKTLSDSESNEDSTPLEAATQPSTSKLNFSQLHNYTKKLEEAKRHIEEYNAKKQAKENELNIENLLAAGEANLKSLSDENRAEIEAALHSSDFESCSDSEKEGWEDVTEQKEQKEKGKGAMPKEGLEITVEMPGAVKKKKGVDLMAAIKRRINRVRKENQVLVHKVHLLCWIAHGNYINTKINSENVLSAALSLIPSQNCFPADRTDLNYLTQILNWFRNAVEIVEKPVVTEKPLDEVLAEQMSKKTAYSKKMLVLIFVAVLRSLGIQCRLLLSFQVEPLRPPNSELHSLSTKAPTSSKKNANTPSKTPAGAKTGEESNLKKPKTIALKAKAGEKSNPEAKKPQTSVRSKSTSNDSKAKASDLETKKSITNARSKNANDKSEGGKKAPKATLEVKNPKPNTRSKSSSGIKSEETDKSRKTNTRSRSTSDVSKRETAKNTKSKAENKPKTTTSRTDTANKRHTRSQKLTIPQVDGANDSGTPPKPNLKKLTQKPAEPLKALPKRAKPLPKYRGSDSEDDFKQTESTSPTKDTPKINGANLKKLKNHVPKALDVRKDIIQIVKKSIKEQKDLTRSRTVRKRKSAVGDSDSDYAPETIKKKHHDSEDEFTPKVKVKRRVQVRPEEDSNVKKKQGLDVWCEAFMEVEEKWISVDVVKGQIHCVKELYTRASHPISYIIAWNNDNRLKDVTKRYCTNFNTVTRKLRIDSKWWEATLRPFTGSQTVRDREEDDELERQQLEKPLPTSIAEYKNHPLYVLKRHLLKFEALYPPDAPTLGFVRNEAVYSIQCVYTLHSRDIWLKHAKVVKPGEQPYKIVKARPKWDKLSNKMITDQLLEVFGPWQVQDYEPPTAENGVVPRNAFGNVELFKPCMLPKKTVHLKLPGLNKVAKKMNIDCAPALVGFDFHGGWNHPTYDGYIVCEEFADVLTAAWEVEQDELERKEQEKIDKRVYGNWKRLIRGLLIRERLKVKYEFGESSGGAGKKKGKPTLKVSRKRKVESESE
ncbi:DNA repair protein complementing XP-C cells homolog [Tribolium castaneum]|uniref:Uncharacterized protein n=1 Tax=Tribolium castaneum TaxID=7070 RepID=D6WR90_TRICA|nr:PREDICTED: DNA repair protein complementing XP-C cells homolog [Tribolium castaneum]XP_975547.1 PREDICTED: DNA repair protein complementing XP-C cells homolog [Tribolium castaneum]EFA05994.1 hypothetical protein TcasGA2_TC008820 [Tribolium castaneum]|eukprot:XP_015837353.1 PREDICTED: DNA repair protein complementing XP-C cells homolog [Tribolium castaneum]